MRRRSRHLLPYPFRKILRSPPRSAGQALLWLAVVLIGVIWMWGGRLLDVAKNEADSAPVPLKSAFIGRVVHVDDGDTVVVNSNDHGDIKVRLSSIDAPETAHGARRPGQPLGEASKAGLQRLIGQKEVTVTCYERDRYDRHICQLSADGLDANAEMVRLGLAWVYRSNPRYVRDKGLYDIERDAKSAGRGVWAQPTSIPPWQWRVDCWKQQRCEFN